MRITKIKKRLVTIEAAVNKIQARKEQLKPKLMLIQSQLQAMNQKIDSLLVEVSTLQVVSRQDDEAEREQRLLARLDAGISVAQIAREFGWSLNSTRNRCSWARNVARFAANFKDAPKVTLETSVLDIQFTTRTHNMFCNSNIRTVGDLVGRTAQELLKYRNFGKLGLTEVEMFLKCQGLALGGLKDPQTSITLDSSVNEIEMSVRAANVLNNANIFTLRDLVSRSERDLLKYRCCGRRAVSEIVALLKKHNFKLSDTNYSIQ